MDNLKQPAYPLPIANVKEGEVMDTADYGKGNVGFTKLELASLMIVAGTLANTNYPANKFSNDAIANDAVKIAEAVLEECNK
jgi:hypothetical protein